MFDVYYCRVTQFGSEGNTAQRGGVCFGQVVQGVGEKIRKSNQYRRKSDDVDGDGDGDGRSTDDDDDDGSDAVVVDSQIGVAVDSIIDELMMKIDDDEDVAVAVAVFVAAAPSIVGRASLLHPTFDRCSTRNGGKRREDYPFLYQNPTYVKYRWKKEKPIQISQRNSTFFPVCTLY